MILIETAGPAETTRNSQSEIPHLQSTIEYKYGDKAEITLPSEQSSSSTKQTCTKEECTSHTSKVSTLGASSEQTTTGLSNMFL